MTPWLRLTPRTAGASAARWRSASSAAAQPVGGGGGVDDGDEAGPVEVYLPGDQLGTRVVASGHEHPGHPAGLIRRPSWYRRRELGDGGVMVAVTDMTGRPLSPIIDPCPWFAERAGDPDVPVACSVEWQRFADAPDLAPASASADTGVNAHAPSFALAPPWWAWCSRVVLPPRLPAGAICAPWTARVAAASCPA